MAGETWWCEAYGPPPEGHKGDWPECFIIELMGRKCLNPVRCAAAMTAERMRAYRRIQELAASGDEIGVFLADAFTRPDQLLNDDGVEDEGPGTPRQ